ncbi:MAG: T9SS type A sorting domain-containing protein [Chitinophagales bacterium]
MKKIFSLFVLLFIFSSFVYAQEQNKRYILLEEFSNTYCPPCIFRHPTFHDNILLEYEDIDAYHIVYHVSTPIPDDIFYQANKEEAEERANYYQIQGTPTLHLLGKFSPSGPAPDYDILPNATLQQYTGSISPLKIEVLETIEANHQRSVNIEVQTVNQIIPSSHFRLRVVVVEKTVEYEPPFEGMETKLYNVFRQTLGGWEGIPFTPAKVGESVSYNYTYSLQEDWNKQQIYIIAFIQDDNNQSILNAGSSWQGETVAIEENSLNTLVQFYPNPSKDFVYIKTEKELQSVQIFDIEGKLLQKTFFDSSNPSIDLRALPKGIYYVSLQSEDKNRVEKIVKW